MKTENEIMFCQQRKLFTEEKKIPGVPHQAEPDTLHISDRKISVGSFLCDSNGPGKTIYVETVPEQELKQRETPRPSEPDPGWWANRKAWDLFLKCV